MIIEDVTMQNRGKSYGDGKGSQYYQCVIAGIGKVGPILPSFQHAPCNPESLEASTKSVDLSVDWSQAGGNRSYRYFV